jgi:Flp pilus assembly protein TadD
VAARTSTLALLLGLVTLPLHAQGEALQRAMALEASGDPQRAVAAYREALADAGSAVPALLGLERSFVALGWPDSLRPLADAMARERPADPSVRGVQLRTLLALGRDDEATAAFRGWARAVPGDAAPFREFARQLYAAGRVTEADAVLRDAALTRVDGASLALEVAQVRAALGRWAEAAEAWREALGVQGYLESAATFSLRNVPVGDRDAVREVLRRPPAELPPRRVLASVEIAWGTGDRAWAALADLAPTPEVERAWQAFAEDAAQRGALRAARDAWVALVDLRPDGARARAGARAALAAGDPAAALRLADLALTTAKDASAVEALTLRIAALAALGRARDAERALAEAGAVLPPASREALREPVARAWVRVGDVDAARRVLRDAPLPPDHPLLGWLALYEGDLVGARAGLRRAPVEDRDAVQAMALLVRTTSARGPALGEGFLALAQRDSARAASRFVAAAEADSALAPAVLGVAARLEAARGRDAAATALWDRIVDAHAGAPEAPEAALERAKQSLRAGQRAEGIARLEALILRWPGSALLPQARRELDRARGAIPPGAP